MKCDKKYMLLYAVTDRAWVGKQSLYEQVESALKGGTPTAFTSGRRTWQQARCARRSATA